MLNNTHVPNEIPTICPAVNFSTFLGDVETGDAETGDLLSELKLDFIPINIALVTYYSKEVGFNPAVI